MHADDEDVLLSLREDVRELTQRVAYYGDQLRGYDKRWDVWQRTAIERIGSLIEVALERRAVRDWDRVKEQLLDLVEELEP